MWSVVYKRAIYEDGTLLFPERLTKEFLEQARRTQGSYIFANQYLNEVIPEDEKSFKKEWLRTYEELPKELTSFGFIDPAISQKDHSDYTGIVVVSVDLNGTWYLRLASRYKLTPTQIVAKMFEITKQFQLNALGVEVVAYQEALLYMCDEEMRRRDVILPVKGITRKAVSKQVRILGLVPRFEWGRILVQRGFRDFEDEYATFPRGSHDDILDALASIEEIAFKPEKEKIDETPPNPNDPKYESWYIRQLVKRQNQ